MAEFGKAHSREEPRFRVEDAVKKALEAYKHLPEDFPEDLKRLSFEKTLEHYLRLVEESERRDFELALERLKAERQLKSDEIVFKAVFGTFGKLFEALFELERPRPIPILPVAVREEAQDGETSIPLPPLLQPTAQEKEDAST